MTKQITVTEALSTLRLMDKKITKRIHNLEFYVVETKQAIQLGNKRLADATEGTKEVSTSYDALLKLMSDRTRLKGAVVESNAKTQVTIGSRTMSVAEAIEYKSSISAELSIQAKLARALSGMQNFLERQERDIKEKVERQVQTILGNKKVIDAGDETFSVIDKQIRLAEEAKVHDVLDVAKLHDKIGEDIQDFTANVDVALTIINSTTMVEF